MLNAELQETKISTNDGLRLFVRTWECSKPKAILCLVHGFGEHSGRYLHVAKRFLKAGFNVIAYDHRGHGQSEGKKGFFTSFFQASEDLQSVLHYATEQWPSLPVILYGHSMGGCVVLYYTLTHKNPRIAGVISTSPWLRLYNPPSGFLVLLSKLMVKAFPRFTFKNKFPPGVLSHDPKVEENYHKDPLVHGDISANLFLGVTQMGEQILAQAPTWSAPLLLAHGDADQVTDFNASFEFSKEAPQDIIIFKRWPGLRHETHNEKNWQEVVDFYIAWAVKKAEQASSQP